MEAVRVIATCLLGLVTSIHTSVLPPTPPVAYTQALYEAQQDEPVIFDVPLERPLQAHLFEVCEDYDIPAKLLLAVMEQESRFETDAVSPGGDMGLMQISPVSGDFLCEELSLTDLMNPRENITAGAYLLSLCRDDNIHRWLMNYNCGKGRAAELWNEGVTSTAYSREVVERMEQYVSRDKR